MSERFRNFCRPYLEKALVWARQSSDVSYNDYLELKQRYDRIFDATYKR